MRSFLHSLAFLCRPRVVISVAIAVFWLVMMAILTRDYVVRRSIGADLLDMSAEKLAEQWEDYEEWMSLRVGAKSQGISYTNIRRDRSSEGYLACNRIWLELALLGGKFPFRLETAALLDSTFHLVRARADLQIDNSQLTFQAMPRGRKLFYRLEYEGAVRTGSQPIPGPISLFDAVRPLVAKRLDLQVGRVYHLAVLDSTWSLREGVAEIRVEARERVRAGGQNFQAYRLAIQLGPMTSTAWVSPEGEILRREFAHNIIMEQITPAEARRRYPGIDALAAIPALKIADFARTDGESEGGALADELGPLNLLLNQFREPVDQ